MTRARRVVWLLAAAVAVLWPARALSPLDGMPLAGAAEAVLIGVAMPALIWLNPGAAVRPWARAIIVGLLAVKLIGAMALSQQGWCARFQTAPFDGVISTIEIREPRGDLRSWDVRADWRSAAPRCTAIVDRAYRSREEFPVWFFNLLNGLRADSQDVTLDLDGYIDVDEPGLLSIDIGEDLAMTAVIDGAAVPGAPRSIAAPLASGPHHVHLRGAARGAQWRFVPLLNGRDAFTAARLTAVPPTWRDRALAGPLALAATALVVALLGTWTWSTFAGGAFGAPALGWSGLATAVAIATGLDGRYDRAVPLMLLAAAFVPVARRHQTLRTAFVLIGIPWLALFVARSAPQVGRITLYSVGDDWHTFQAAAYSIVLNGDWLRGGSPTFYFQPLYRWVVGGLHVLFGDPSIGESYWDAACLLMASLLCFALVKPFNGFRAATIAAALTLAVFAIGPIWHLIGRGLSDITGTGWMALAVMSLARAKVGNARAAVAAGLFAVLMFWTRPNHLLLAGFLLAALLPLKASAAWPEIVAAVRRLAVKPAAIYAAIAAVGVALSALRTWAYTGHFSIVYGTSFGQLQSGLRLSTIVSPAVWRNIAEAFAAQMTMREPPAFDARALPLAAGVLLAGLAALQVRWFSRLSGMLAILTLGSVAGSFVAHTHDYPGRLSVHVVPFAVAVSVCTLGRLVRGPAFRRDVQVAVS